MKDVHRELKRPFLIQRGAPLISRPGAREQSVSRHCSRSRPRLFSTTHRSASAFISLSLPVAAHCVIVFFVQVPARRETLGRIRPFWPRYASPLCLSPSPLSPRRRRSTTTTTRLIHGARGKAAGTQPPFKVATLSRRGGTTTSTSTAESAPPVYPQR